MKAIGGTPPPDPRASTCAPRCCSAPLGSRDRRRARRRGRERDRRASSRSRSSAISPASASRCRSSSPAPVVGLSAPPLAALPAIRRAPRAPGARGAGGRPAPRSAAKAALDALLRRVTFLPRTAQIGIRSVTRRKRRSLATALQIALAVGDAARAARARRRRRQRPRASASTTTTSTSASSTVASKPFDTDAGRSISRHRGVAAHQPWLSNIVKVERQGRRGWGLPARPLCDTRIDAGRWYTPAEAARTSRVAVLGRHARQAPPARTSATRVTLQTPAAARRRSA